jgi:hypothetical protein
VPPNGVLLLDVLCTCMSARCEHRRLFGLLDLLGVWRAELSELLCDFAAWFSASPLLSSVVCRCSWLGVCSAAGVSASGFGELRRSRRVSRRLLSGRVSAGFPTKLWQMPILSFSHLFAVAARGEDALCMYLQHGGLRGEDHYICRLLQRASWSADTAPSAGRLASRLHGNVAEGAQVAVVCLTRDCPISSWCRPAGSASRPRRRNGVDNFIGM